MVVCGVTRSAQHVHIVPANVGIGNHQRVSDLILRSRALARRREGWPQPRVADPSRRGQEAAPLAITAKPLRGDDGGVCAAFEIGGHAAGRIRARRLCPPYASEPGRRVGKGALAPCPPSIHTTVILRCSPFFTASLEGWATSACCHPSRRGQEAAPQDDGGVCAAFEIGGHAAGRIRARRLCPPYASEQGRRVGKGALAPCPPSIHTTVILRCSPFFTASLDGWATSVCCHPSTRAKERPPLAITAKPLRGDDGDVCAAFEIGGHAAGRIRARRLCPPYASDNDSCPGRSAARSPSRSGALQSRGRTELRRLVRSRLCAAA